MRECIACVVIIALVSKIADATDCEGYGNKGPYKVGYKSDPSINMKNRNFDIYLYYPATADGADAPLISGGPFPVVSFAHGLIQPLFEYTSYFEHLASWGFLVIGPNSDYDLGLQYFLDRFATDMRLCLDYLEAANEDTNSWLYGKVDIQNSGVTGHSEGGFMTLYSTSWPAVDPRVKAMVPIAGLETTEALLNSLTCPTLILSGDDDFISTPSEGVRIYSKISSIPKMLTVIKGGWHCGFMDESIELPDVLCRSLTGWMSRDEQMKLTHCLVTSFFLAHLQGDADAAEFVYRSEAHLPKITTKIDVGFALTAADRKMQNCSSVNIYTLNVTNYDLQPTAFDIYVASSSENVLVSPTQTPVLAPGQSAEIVVKLGSSKKTAIPKNSATIGAMSSNNNIARTFMTVIGATEGYKLVVIANRDELLDRPTEAAKFWEDSGFLILGGRDLARKGTWFGVTKTGRIAMVTNYRVAFDQLRTDAKSRGQILLDFLKTDVSPREFIHKLHQDKTDYDGFNVILGTTDELWYFGNKDEKDKPILLEKGKFYGLSNRILDTPWQKVELGKQMLSEIDIKSYNGDEDKFIADLFKIMDDRRNVPRDDMVPDTGVGFEIEKHMQPIFIDPFPMLNSVFGTRAQTVLLIDEENCLTFAERALLPGGNDWQQNKFKFQINPATN